MKTASDAEVQSKFDAVLKASEGGPVVVTRKGKPVAVLVCIRDEDEVERLLMAYSPQLRAILERSDRQLREGRGLSSDEFWAQVGATTPPKGKRPPRRKRA